MNWQENHLGWIGYFLGFNGLVEIFGTFPTGFEIFGTFPTGLVVFVTFVVSTGLGLSACARRVTVEITTNA